MVLPFLVVEEENIRETKSEFMCFDGTFAKTVKLTV